MRQFWLNEKKSVKRRVQKIGPPNWRSRAFSEIQALLRNSLSSDTSLELAVLIPNFAPLLRLLFFWI